MASWLRANWGPLRPLCPRTSLSSVIFFYRFFCHRQKWPWCSRYFDRQTDRQTDTHTHTHTHKHTHAHAHAHIHTQYTIYTYKHTHTHAHTQGQHCHYTHTHTQYTHINTHSHTHTHTHTGAASPLLHVDHGKTTFVSSYSYAMKEATWTTREVVTDSVLLMCC
jgi:hypothetical protein